MKRRIAVGLLFTVILAIALFFRLSRNIANMEYPKVFLTNEDSGISFNIHAGGYAYRPAGSMGQKESDFSIRFNPDSTIAKFEDHIEIEGTTANISFYIKYTEDTSGVQVLRWPMDEYGTNSPLDTSERIAYQTKGNRRYFTVEPGYLYSIYITWADCFIEYPFQVFEAN